MNINKIVKIHLEYNFFYNETFIVKFWHSFYLDKVGKFGYCKINVWFS